MDHEVVHEVSNLLVKGISSLCFRSPSFLSKDIYSDLNVMDVNGVNVIKIHVVHRTVQPGDSRNLTSLDPIVFEQMRSSMLVLMVPLSHPPVVAKSINNTFSFNIDVLAVFKPQEVHGIIAIKGP